MTDEPIVIAHLMAKAGQMTAGVLVERSLIGQAYLESFREACRDEGIRIVAEETIAQTGLEIDDAVHAMYDAKPDAIVHLGFGLGVVGINHALRAVGWDPPRYMGTAFEDAYVSPEIWDPSSGGSGSSSTTKPTRSVRSSSPASRRSTGGVRSTSRRWCSTMSPSRCSMRSPTRSRCHLAG